eukprot:272126_1
MSHPTITQNGAQKKRSMDHQTTAKARYPAMQKKRKHHQKEKQPQKGGRAIKLRTLSIFNPSCIQNLQWNTQRCYLFPSFSCIRSLLGSNATVMISYMYMTAMVMDRGQ